MKLALPSDELTIHIASYTDTAVLIGALSEAPLGGGHHCLYVLHFTNGLTKVGRTAAPRRRLRQHIREARRWDVELAAGWVSAPFTADAVALERQLIEQCRTAADAGANRSTEYFTGLPFEQVRRFALAMTPIGPLDLLMRRRSQRADVQAPEPLSPVRLLTVEAAATVLGLDPCEVRKLCRLERLRCRRVGSAIRVPGSAIPEFRSDHALLASAVAPSGA